MKGTNDMLTQTAQELLDYLIACHKDDSPKYFPDDIDEIFTSETASEINEILDYLAEQGYIKLRRYTDGANNITLTHKGLHYKDFVSAESADSRHVYNINAPVTNSAIGNTGTITISTGISFQEVREFIQQQNLSFEEHLEIEKIISSLETLVENSAPIKKGFLAKFSDTIAKHHWLPELLMKSLFSYFLGV